MKNDLNFINVITHLEESIKLIDEMQNLIDSQKNNIAGNKPMFTEEQIEDYKSELYSKIYKLAKNYYVDNLEICPFCF